MSRKNVTDAFILYGIAFLFGYFVLSGKAYFLHPAVAIISFIIYMMFVLQAVYILLRGVVSHGEWTHHFFLRIRLRMKAREWYECIDYIKETGDFGMCCNEVMAIDCAKRNIFGALYEYAGEFTQDGHESS